MKLEIDNFPLIRSYICHQYNCYTNDLLVKNAQRTTGNQAQLSNIEAAKAMSEVVRTSLGPRAMLKMVIDQMGGGIVVTSDGNAVLRELEVVELS